MTNKPITPEEMKAYVDATWEKCQAEAWQEPVCGHGVRITKCPFCQPLEQKPVAWYCNEGLNRGVSLKQEGHEWTPLYTTPPRREWQGLTEEEIARRESVKPILVRIMQEAYDLADRDDSEGYNSVKVMCSEVLGMINELLDERQWQGLTDDEADELVRRFSRYELLRAIEAKLKEKNHA